jgi:hypothetical protein
MQWFPLAFCMIVFRHTVGLLWTSEQPVSETLAQQTMKNAKDNIGIATTVLFSKKLERFKTVHCRQLHSNGK